MVHVFRGFPWSRVLLALLTGCAAGLQRPAQPELLPRPSNSGRTLETVDVPTLDTQTLVSLVPGPEWVPAFNPLLGWDANPRGPNGAVIELHRRAVAGELAAGDWERILDKERIIRSRARWPRGEPIRLRVEPPFWLGDGIEYRVTIRCEDRAYVVRHGRTSGQDSCIAFPEVGFGAGEKEGRDGFVETSGPVGPLATDVRQLDMRVEIRVRGGGDLSTPWEDAKVAYLGELRRPLETVGSVDDVMAGRQGEDVERAVRRALKVSILGREWNDASRHAELTVELDRRTEPALERLGVGLCIEVRRDGRVVDTASVWGDKFWQWSPGRYLAQNIEMPRLALDLVTLRDQRETDLWTVVVRGVGRLALTSWDYDAYWAGEYAIPLAQVLKLELPSR